MPQPQPESTAFDLVLELLTEHGFPRLAQALEILLNEAMALERSEFLRAKPYERTEERRGFANGFKPKGLKTRLGELSLRIPQVRDLPEGEEPFYPKALERGVRSERALKLALAEMYVQGVSTRKVAEVTRELCGFDVSSSQVSRATALLDRELEGWRCRPLGRTPYLFLDARYEKVRHGGTVVDCSVLIAVGTLTDGRRTILGLSVSLSEAEVHWRDFLETLQTRGMHGVEMVTSDDHAGRRAALAARLHGTPWQRCQFHLQQNAMHYVPRLAMRKPVARDLRGVFDAPDAEEARRRLKIVCEKWRPEAPQLASWMEENVPEGLTVFLRPPAHRRRVRTVNIIERLNKEIHRRTRVATLFPNEASLLRLVSAVLIEISEEWESERTYLNMEQE
jgi:transposase-like protein